MALITPTPSGSAIAYISATAGGDTYANSGRQRAHVRNGGGSPVTVTIRRTVACSQGVIHADAAALASDQFVITGGSDAILPAVDPALYGSTTELEYSGVTTVTVAVLA